MNGTFTSVWDSGDIIETPAELFETGEVFTHSVDVDELDLDKLNDEYFTDFKGEVYQICRTCHTYITKTDMVTKASGQVKRTGCTDPKCENYYENY